MFPFFQYLERNRNATLEGPSNNTRSRWRAIATDKNHHVSYAPHIGFDNWEVIAGHLDLLGLLNLADNVCVDARQAAQWIFKRRYSSYIFRLLLADDAFGRQRRQIAIHSVNDKMAWIDNYSICLKLLRIFGSFISQLEIDPYKYIKPVKLHKILKYVNKYCVNSKNELILHKYLPILFKEPLNNVTEITVRTADYSVAEFKSLFPNIEYLKIYSDAGRIYMQHHFPRLEHLYLIIYKYGDRDGINIGDIWKAVKLNPQIKSIYIEQIVHNSIENMFEMVIKGVTIEFYFEWNLHWSKMKRFLLDTIRTIKFEKLYLFHHNEIDGIEQFVNEFKNLKCFIVESFEKHLLQLIESLPLLQDFQICFREYRDIDEDIDSLAHAITSSIIQQKLSVLSFHFEQKVALDVFHAGINRFIDRKVWLININESGPKTFKQSMVLNRKKWP